MSTILTQPCLTRLPDWHARLISYVNATRHKPFEVGELDCAIFWIGAVEAMTGRAPIEVTWRNMGDCRSMLRSNGYSMERAFRINEVLGAGINMTEGASLRRGDIAIMHQPSQGDTFALVWDRRHLIGVGAEHLKVARATAAHKFWRVG